MTLSFKAVFFDMDGIIVDSMPYHFVSWFEAARKYGVHLNPMIIFSMEGSKYADVLALAFARSNKPLTPEIINQIPQEREELFKGYFRRYIFEGIPEFIKSLKNQGVLVGLVTGSYYREVERILLKELFDLFDTVVAGDCVNKGKPDPEPYLTAARNLKVVPKDCLVVENAPYGVKAAKTAGMTCFAVATSLPKEYLSQADSVFGTHEELYKYFECRQRKSDCS
ncbi:MAG: HAD family phosphatase [Endomicrobium sp.]|jgi:beta-phosphoglucomutase|nr:HAD family phosphatase [Endomicrobium sp.]